MAFLKPLKSQYGFSLIEVMIVAGIGTIVALGFAQMSISQMQSMVYLEDRLAGNDLKNIVNGYFLNEESCRNTLRNNNAAQTRSIASIRNQSNQILFSTGNTNNQFGDFLDVTAMELQPMPGQTVGPTSTGIMNLEIELTRRRNRGGQEQVFVDVPVLVQTDGSSTVTSCVSPGGTLANPPISPTAGGPSGTNGPVTAGAPCSTNGLLRTSQNCNTTSPFNNCRDMPKTLYQCSGGTWSSVVVVPPANGNYNSGRGGP